MYLQDVPGVPPETHPKSKYGRMVRHTLDALAAGGIRDHLGGGFHRYSTDAKWLVPHFEIMLYDNAMLAWCYAEAYRQFGEEHYAQVARGVLDFVLREMTSPDGAFYTAIDAEVDGQEGLNYLWTKDEIEAVLGAEDAKLFNASTASTAARTSPTRTMAAACRTRTSCSCRGRWRTSRTPSVRQPPTSTPG